MDLAAAEYRDRDPLPADLASAFNLEDELKALLATTPLPTRRPNSRSLPLFRPNPAPKPRAETTWHGNSTIW